jgi:hypothetical protein
MKFDSEKLSSTFAMATTGNGLVAVIEKSMNCILNTDV